jgi:hypothetical protein
MNRASLLHILDNLGGISETEVQELEQLAATFPYCQTAHLLLAKAAHDRGSMLAAQRLRRAATYAVDRQRLRALIELPAPLLPAEVAAPAEVQQIEAASVFVEIAPQSAPISVATSDSEEPQTSINASASELELVENQSLTSVDLAITNDSQQTPIILDDEVAEEEATVAVSSSEEISLNGSLEKAPPSAVEAAYAAESIARPEEQVDESQSS